MTKKILALVLALMMVVCALPLSVAADDAALPSLGDQLNKIPIVSNLIIRIDTDTVVDTDLIVPPYVTIALTQGVTLYVRAKLYVYGKITGAGKYVEEGDGKVCLYNNTYYPGYYPGYGNGNNMSWPGACPYVYGCYNYPACCHTIADTNIYNTGYWTSYDPSKPWTYYPCAALGGTYCKTCKTNTICWCTKCNTYHCALERCYADTVIDPNYCYTHSQYRVYCSYCQKMYCPACDGGLHTGFDASTGKCIITSLIPSTPSVPSFPIYDPNYIYQFGGLGLTYAQYIALFYNIFGYYPNIIPINPYGQINYLQCAVPTANIATGSTVAKGSTIELSCATPNATIYYTLNGMEPRVGTNYTFKYTGPITIENDITILARAINAYNVCSASATFAYKAVNPVDPSMFTDIAGYDIAAELGALVKAGVIKDSKYFRPDAPISYDDLAECFENIGLDMSKATFIDLDDYSDLKKLNFNEYAMIVYRVLLGNDVIQAYTGSSSLRLKLQMKNYKDVPASAAVKNAYASLLTNDLFYAKDFKPGDTIPRVYLAKTFARILELMK